MKRALILLGLALCILCFTSCEESSKSGMPTLMEVMLKPSEDFYLILEYRKEHDVQHIDMYIELLSKNRLSSLALNEIPLLPDYFSYDANQGYYRYVFGLGLNDNVFIGDYDEELDYHLVFENKVARGTLRIPSEYHCAPPEFDHDQDYELDWTLQHNPRMQNISFSLNIDSGSWADFVRELKVDQRHCTLNKADWEHLGRLSRGRFTLEASNYHYTNGGLVWIISSFRYQGAYAGTHQRDSGVDRLEKLLSGEIVLPR
ncbi:MAG: hypothetical protein WC944_08980 [Candidatus Cloacimonadaceae bacterium]|nr:hypothetical protein [Candidatus Cloacimonadota bacterium]MCB5254411.1 hypothetical protein [Candidatus Cloacimonadota bacterium]MCK9179011.1 hypothetical protein [Candidatus Cloacimonadota bacterium]MDD3534211.1 hypothetical protein [Candidatus Cloacimonadota bacterium]